MFHGWLTGALRHLRQCVMEVFCSTSTDRSRKSSSLLLTCKQRRRRSRSLILSSVMQTNKKQLKYLKTALTASQLRQRVSLVSVPWKISWTQVCCVSFPPSPSPPPPPPPPSLPALPPPPPPPPFCTSLPFCCRSWLFSSWSRSAMVLRR